MDGILNWFESQWAVVAPIVISAVPVVITIGSLISNARKIFENGKNLANSIIGDVKGVVNNSYTEVKSLINSEINSLKREVADQLSTVKNDNAIMAEMITEVVLSKNISTQTKANLVKLSGNLKNENIKRIVEKAATTEQKVTENLQGVQLGKPIEIPTPTTNKAPVSTQAKSTYISNSQ